MTDTISEVGRQAAVPDLRPGGKDEIAPRDVSTNPVTVTIEHEGVAGRGGRGAMIAMVGAG